MVYERNVVERLMASMTYQYHDNCSLAVTTAARTVGDCASIVTRWSISGAGTVRGFLKKCGNGIYHDDDWGTAHQNSERWKGKGDGP